MKRLAAALVMMLSVLAIQPAEAAPPDFAVTDCPGMSDSVLRLYTAGLGRTAEQGGYEFWLAEYQAGSWSLQRAAEHFVVSDEFVASYGALDNLAFVQQIYRNVLDREGEASGVDFWTSQLNSGARSRAIVLLNFSESPENVQRSGTTPPSLGDFNGGLDTPWTCAQQPAAGTCNVGAWIGELLEVEVPEWDVTIEIPDSMPDSNVRALIEVDRNGTLLGTIHMSFDNVRPGERMRGLAAIGSYIIDDVPIDELTCRVAAIEGHDQIRDGLLAGDLESASCQTDPAVADVPSIGRYVGSTTTVVNTTNAVALGTALIILRVDGFRIAQLQPRFPSVQPGASATDNLGLFGELVFDAVPIGIDPRRVTCEVVELFWSQTDAG